MAEVVAITGASSGIGKALAVAWARLGATLVLSGRNEAALAEVARDVAGAGGTALVEPGDVTDEGHCRRFVERALRSGGRLDVLVNNAGRGYYAPSLEIDPAELRALFELNVVAPLRLTQIAKDALTESRGTVVMLSSVAGVVAAPRLGAYSATKFALEALSMSMRAELRGRGVRVVVIRPGPVDTPFRRNAVAPRGNARVGPDTKPQSADDVARQTLAAVRRGRPVVETSWFVRGASLGARLSPAGLRWMFARMAKTGA